MKVKSVLKQLSYWGPVVFLFVGFVLVLTLEIRSMRTLGHSQWDPLGDYPEQIVLNESRTGGLPVVLPGELVEVAGMKCADEEVHVAALVTWRPVGHPEDSILSISSGDIRREGCSLLRYNNPIPLEVRHLIANEGHSLWQITGVEIPFDPMTGHQGTPRSWATEVFVISTEGPA